MLSKISIGHVFWAGGATSWPQAHLVVLLHLPTKPLLFLINSETAASQTLAVRACLW